MENGIAEPDPATCSISRRASASSVSRKKVTITLRLSLAARALWIIGVLPRAASIRNIAPHGRPASMYPAWASLSTAPAGTSTRSARLSSTSWTLTPIAFSSVAMSSRLRDARADSLIWTASNPGAISPRLPCSPRLRPAVPASAGSRVRIRPISAGSISPIGVSIIFFRCPGVTSLKVSMPSSGERPSGRSNPAGFGIFWAICSSISCRPMRRCRPAWSWLRPAQVAKLKSASAADTTTVAPIALVRDRRFRLEPMGTSPLKKPD